MLHSRALQAVLGVMYKARRCVHLELEVADHMITAALSRLNVHSTTAMRAINWV